MDTLYHCRNETLLRACKVIRVKQMAGSNRVSFEAIVLRDNRPPTSVLSSELRVLSCLLKASLSICNIDSTRFASCYNPLQTLFLSFTVFVPSIQSRVSDHWNVSKRVSLFQEILWYCKLAVNVERSISNWFFL